MTTILFTFTHEILFHSFNIKKPETTKYTKVYVYRAYITHLMFVVYKKYFLSFHTFGEYNPCGQSMLHNTAKIGLKQVLIQSLATFLTRSFYRYRPIYIFCILFLENSEKYTSTYGYYNAGI